MPACDLEDVATVQEDRRGVTAEVRQPQLLATLMRVCAAAGAADEADALARQKS